MSHVRFYVAPETAELKHDFWLHDEELKKRFSKSAHEGDELILFDGVSEDRLYKLIKIEEDGIHLEMVTEFDRKLPKRHLYLFWALLPGEDNNAILQQCTELGVSNFIPLITEKGEKTFDAERARLTIITAAEAGQWSLVPHIREPLTVDEMINEYGEKVTFSSTQDQPTGIVIGPENGWTEPEQELLKQARINGASFKNTVEAIEAIAKLLQ